MTSTVNYKTHWHQNFVTYWESLYASSIRKTFGLTSPRCCRLNLSFLTPTFPHWQAVCVITGLVQSPFPGQSALMPLTLNLSHSTSFSFADAFVQSRPRLVTFMSLLAFNYFDCPQHNLIPSSSPSWKYLYKSRIHWSHITPGFYQPAVLASPMPNEL